MMTGLIVARFGQKQHGSQLVYANNQKESIFVLLVELRKDSNCFVKGGQQVI